MPPASVSSGTTSLPRPTIRNRSMCRAHLRLMTRRSRAKSGTAICATTAPAAWTRPKPSRCRWRSPKKHPKPEATMPDDELDVEAIYAKRIAGVSVKRIAKMFKTTEATINALLLERTKEVLSIENTRIMVGMESDRLDQFLEALWPKVMEGNEVAIGLSVKIAQRRAVGLGSMR